MKRKEKEQPHRGPGRPNICGQRVAWLVHLPVEIAARIDKRRKKRSRAAVILEAVRRWLGER